MLTVSGISSVKRRRAAAVDGPVKINLRQLVTISVSGEIAHPEEKPGAYRIGRDGRARILPATGGVVSSHRIGDRCLGLAADHVEPGVSIRNNAATLKTDKLAANRALNTLACVGNRAVVVNGPCRGARGMVTGKHGGVDHVLVDFPLAVLKNLQIGNLIQIDALGTGMRFAGHPAVKIMNCSPALIRRWGINSHGGRLVLPVAHVVPAVLMGSGMGRSQSVRGDYDIQLTNPQIVRRLGLQKLRFGDLVVITDSDNRFGRTYRPGYVTIGIIVHGDSVVSGHGPGVTTLMTGPADCFLPQRRQNANLADLFRRRGLREPLLKNSWMNIPLTV